MQHPGREKCRGQRAERGKEGDGKDGNPCKTGPAARGPKRKTKQQRKRPGVEVPAQEKLSRRGRGAAVKAGPPAQGATRSCDVIARHGSVGFAGMERTWVTSRHLQPLNADSRGSVPFARTQSLRCAAGGYRPAADQKCTRNQIPSVERMPLSAMKGEIGQSVSGDGRFLDTNSGPLALFGCSGFSVRLNWLHARVRVWWPHRWRSALPMPPGG